MTRRRVNYDQLASSYDARYQVGALQEIADALLELASRSENPAVLEVGCGTGRWLRELKSRASMCCGADPSIEMLRKGRSGGLLVNAHANALPFGSRTFDLVYVVNALHHFYNPRGFIEDAVHMLRPSGMLAIIGIDPRTIRIRYFYDYFEGTRRVDMERYPSFGQQVDWMAEAGLDNVEHRIVHTYRSHFIGREVFSDPFLKQESNSLLALLSANEYGSGIKRIEQAITEAAVEATFDTVLPFGLVAGALGAPC